MSDADKEDPSLNASSLDNSWLVCESHDDTSAINDDMSIISSQTTSDSENSGISLQPDDSTTSLDPQNAHQPSTTTNSPRPQNTIHDSYNLNIADVLPMLSSQTMAKFGAVVDAKRAANSTMASVIAQKRLNYKRADTLPERATGEIKIRKQETILDKLRGSKDDDATSGGGVLDAATLSILAGKQREFMAEVRQSELGAQQRSKEAREADRERKERGLRVACGERDAEKPELRTMVAPPNHQEPEIDLAELLRANQTDAQLMVSAIKQKNKAFIEAIFD